MVSNFDVKDIMGLKFEVTASRCCCIEMNACEGWLYVSTDTIDDMNRTIDYSNTFPLDEWMLDEIRKIAKDSDVPFWEPGECQYRSRVDYGIRWDLFISTSDKEFRYNGWDAFPRGYDIFSRELNTLTISLFDWFRMDMGNLKEVYLCTDSKMNGDSFSLSDDSLYATINDRRESLDTVPEHLDAIRTILKDYSLHPYAPEERRPMESGESIRLQFTDRYENSLCLWWGKDRQAWVDDMVQRLHDAMKEAYRDVRTVAKPIDPFLPRDPDKYYLSEATKKIITDHLGTVGKELPIDQDELLETWNYIVDKKKHLLRRLCIGKQVDMGELERTVHAAEEMDQFRFGRLDCDKINELLGRKDW